MQKNSHTSQPASSVINGVQLLSIFRFDQERMLHHIIHLLVPRVYPSRRPDGVLAPRWVGSRHRAANDDGERYLRSSGAAHDRRDKL